MPVKAKNDNDTVGTSGPRCRAVKLGIVKLASDVKV